MVAALLPTFRALYEATSGSTMPSFMDACIDLILHFDLWFYQTNLLSTFRVIGGWDDLLRLFGLYAMTLLPQFLYGSLLSFLGTELDRAISAAFQSIHVQIQREFTFFRADLKAQYTREVQLIQTTYQDKLARAEAKYKADLHRERNLNFKKLKRLKRRLNSTSSAKLRNAHHSSKPQDKLQVKLSTQTTRHISSLKLLAYEKLDISLH